MTISYTTFSQLHRKRFKPVRFALLGVKITATVENDLTGVGLIQAPVAVEKIRSHISATTILKSATRVLTRWLIKTVLFLSISIGIAFAAFMIIPRAYYLFNPVETAVLQTTEVGTPLGGQFDQDLSVETPGRKYQPPVDTHLPTGEWLMIPRIGVNTELRQTPNPEEALEVGVWMVPDFGKAGDTDVPLILAAHRYGWQWWWKDEYWKYHSFYLLPDTEPGDRIEIISEQRKWIYEIYAGEEGEEISDYDADLILYTCKFLNSPVRHFRYAKLIDPTADSQQAARL